MSEPTASTVRLSHDGAIATLTLHRPAARNALDLPMACALRDAVDAVLRGESPSPAQGPAIGCYISDLR